MSDEELGVLYDALRDGRLPGELIRKLLLDLALAEMTKRWKDKA